MSISDFEGLICPACSNPIDEEFLAKTISCSHCKTNLKDKKYLAFIEYLILHGIIDVNFFDHTLYGEEVGRTTEEEELHDETDPNDYEDTSKRINYDEKHDLKEVTTDEEEFREWDGIEEDWQEFNKKGETDKNNK
ncbi:MAG: hypothetical protein CMF82_04225 [Candidatus Marinimicrobia bacterium]|nr:hypothetical protein [Candidatus Neomarinimicrobiota bacterium]|tara:strand:- start:3818 stop:4225 length:408 start_codon:yes stop_codon:yes gene_type:complete